MSSLFKTAWAVSVSATLLVTSASALATNGYFLPGYGAKSIGMGGVGVAFAQDALASAANPAGVIEVGTRADLGIGLFNPPRRAYVDARGSFFGDNTGEARSKNDWFLVPNMGYVSQINARWAWSVAVYGNGLGTTYKPNFYDFTGTSGDTLGVELMQVLMPITLALRVNEVHAVAASLVLGRQRFRAKGLDSFRPVSSDPNSLTDKGFDFGTGAGVRLGWTGKFAGDKLTLGATYASKVYMSRFSQYKGLFPDAGNFDVPANYAIGLAWKMRPSLTVAMDIERILYTGVPYTGNRGPELLTGSPLGTASSPSKIGALGLKDGMGFGWTDQTVYKLGVNVVYNQRWTYRAGLNYGKTPIPADQYAFNVIAPATVEKHIAFGFTHKLAAVPKFGKSAELTGAYLHAFNKKLSGQSALGTDSNGTEFNGQAELEMKQNEIELSYALKF